MYPAGHNPQVPSQTEDVGQPEVNTASDLDLLRVFLACGSLPHNWYDSYGVRKARSDALTKRSTRKAGYSSDSFINPNSETALTLFMLGATDGWQQVNTFRQSPRPRVAGKDWNQKFFANLRAAPAKSANSTLWRHHTGDGSLFCNDVIEWNKLILLFEVEIAGKAFHQRAVNEEKFADVSFLKVDDLKKWSKFDAVLIDPVNKWLYFIEAKLKSDASTGTKKYPHVNQIVRSLEAAFWLTTHPESKYRDWKFRYAFISPRLIHDYKLRYYAFAFNAVDEMLTNYGRLLRDIYSNDLRLDAVTFEQRFSEFQEKARESVRVVNWGTFGKVLLDQRPQLWDGYFDRIRGLYAEVRPEGNAEKVVQNIKKRLRVAGVEFRG